MEITLNKQRAIKRLALVCPECNGTGRIIVEESTENTKELYGDNRKLSFVMECPSCNGGLIKRAEEVKQRANIPALYYDKELKDFEWEIYKKDGNTIDLSKHKACIEDFVNNYKEWKAENQGLYIYSTMRGTGKTFLASCICKEIMAKYAIITKFVQATSLIEESKKSQLADNGTSYIDLLKRCELLVLDDIGINNTEWMNSLLFEILDHRYQNQLVTIITANIPQSELSKTMDDRLVDRIYSNTTPIHLPEYAVRQKDAQEHRTAFLKKRGLI